jgi:hypothetical protein
MRSEGLQVCKFAGLLSLPRWRWGWIGLFVALIVGGCGSDIPAPSPTPDYSDPRVEVLVDGLFGPIGLAELSHGEILVAEEGTGGNDASAGISLIMPDGERGQLISGLPSTRDAGDLAGVPMIALAPDGSRLYLSTFGQGHLLTLPLTPEQQQNGLTIPATPYTPDDLVPEMLPLNNVFLVNPFDIVFEMDGTPVVTDASSNGVAIKNSDGTTRFFHRFEKLPAPQDPTLTIEAVPTGIERWHESEYLVTLTGGCPYPPESGQLVIIDKARHQRTVVDGLNMPIDIVRGPDGTLWLLEFAQFTAGSSCFDGSGYQPGTGRLSRVLPDWSLQPVLTDLDFPGAVLPASDGALYISEVLTGRVLRVTFE